MAPGIRTGWMFRIAIPGNWHESHSAEHGLEPSDRWAPGVTFWSNKLALGMNYPETGKWLSGKVRESEVRGPSEPNLCS